MYNFMKTCLWLIRLSEKKINYIITDHLEMLPNNKRMNQFHSLSTLTNLILIHSQKLFEVLFFKCFLSLTPTVDWWAPGIKMPAEMSMFFLNWDFLAWNKVRPPCHCLIIQPLSCLLKFSVVTARGDNFSGLNLWSEQTSWNHKVQILAEQSKFFILLW